jgi:hypothetical protein
MGRTWGQPFQTEAMADLTRQLGFAPAAQRARQVEAAERLHDELDPDTTYPFSFVVYRVTGARRPAGEEEVFLVGTSAAHDLRLMIDRLSRTVELAEPAGGVVSPSELAAAWGTSVKTITRWRSAGLRWRWMPGPGGSGHRVVICRSAAEAFEQGVGRGRIDRAAAFSRIDDATQARMLDQARRLAARRGATLNRVARQLADEHGRGLETVRQLLQRHDRDHPDDAVFPAHHGPLTPQQRADIEQAYRRGVDATELAERFGRSLSTVYRVVSEARARRLLAEPIEWVELSVFSRDDAEAVILRQRFGDVDWTAGQPVIAPDPQGLPAWLVEAGTRATLTAERSRSLLVRMNYLKRRAGRMRDELSAREPSTRLMHRIETWLGEVEASRRLVFMAHLPRLLAVARRQWQSTPSARRRGMTHWVALGVAALDEAIVSYDPSRTQPFDAYLVNRLLQRYTPKATARDAGRSPVATDEDALRQRFVAMGLAPPAVSNTDPTADPTTDPAADPGITHPPRTPDPPAA